jgi:glycosyltransferase involved in cell wall biosynthesis
MTAPTPRLSVVIPAYNVEKYVQEAVDSVIRQTAPAHEIVIVDDGSTDRTGQIVEDLYGHLGQVRIIHTANQGLGMARNVGAEAATGDFIYYFDSDDVLNPVFFKKFFDVYTEHPNLDLFCFSARSFFDEPARSKGFALNRYRRGSTAFLNSGEEALNFLMDRGGYFAPSWLFIYRRAVAMDNNIRFLPIIHEDEEHTPRLFLKSGATYICDDEFFFRRIRANSIMTSRKSERHINGYFRAVQAIQTLLRSDGLRPETYRTLQKLKIRIFVNAALAYRANEIEVGDPELKLFPKTIRRHAMTDGRLFLLTYLFPAYKAARSVKRVIGRLRD